MIMHIMQLMKQLFNIKYTYSTWWTINNNSEYCDRNSMTDDSRGGFYGAEIIGGEN